MLMKFGIVSGSLSLYIMPFFKEDPIKNIVERKNNNNLKKMYTFFKRLYLITLEIFEIQTLKNGIK